MSNNYNSIIDQDWDDIAIDDGTILNSFGSYSVRIYPREDTTSDVIESQIENISYSPEVNSVKGLSVDVEPLEELEGEDYLGGIVDVFVNKNPIFSGKIYKINTTQKEGDYYKIEVESPAKELRNETINESTDNFLLSDYVAKTIDKFNGFHDEHFNLIDTDQEVLTNINKLGRAREAEGNSQVAYRNVGDTASEVDILYVKLSVNNSVEINIGNDNKLYTEIINDSKGTYGEWFQVYPENLDNSEYDISYNMEEGSVLYDWIAVTDSKITRTVEPEVAGTVIDDELVQLGNNQQSFENSTNISDTDPYYIENGKVKSAQTAFVRAYPDGFTESFSGGVEDPIYTNGLADRSTETFDKNKITFENKYTIPAENVIIALRRGEEDDSGNISVDLDGTEVSSVPRSTNFEWSILEYDEDNGDIEPGVHELEVYISESIGDEQLTLDVVSILDDRYDYNFDEQVHEDNGHLDGPSLFPNQNVLPTLRFAEINFGEIVESSNFNVDANGPSLPELGISFNSGESFLTEENVNSIEKNNSLISSTITTKIKTIGWEENGVRNDSTPRKGYSGQEISLYELYATTNDIEVLFNSEISGNKLKVITDIIDDSRYYYRVEGNGIRLFKRGSKKTNIDLRKENITSSVSIEDVYSSCEVIGDGITSGIIESGDAPEYVNRHKEIRDPDITTEDDAVRKARSFLGEHSDIEYQGDITTLPTLAPLGEEIDGAIFGHGQDSFIESVRYGKRRTTIDLGRQKTLSDELLDLDRGVDSDRTRNTGI